MRTQARREREAEVEGGEEEEMRRGRGEEKEERRAVLFGVALKLVRGKEGEESGSDSGIGTEERELFKNVMEMVKECWEDL